MLIESIRKTGDSSIFNIHQANFKSAHLLHKMAKGFIFNPTTEGSWSKNSENSTM